MIEPELTEALVEYVQERYAREDAVLTDLRAALVQRGMPMIHVSPATGRVLQVLVAAAGGRRVLEVGTLGGYSAIWMARGLTPGGHLTTVELEPERAELARSFLAEAGVADAVEVIVGDARALLPTLGPDGAFDVVFLDADKEGYAGYAREADRLLRPGGLLLADNAFWSGRVLEAPMDDATRGIQAFNDALAGGRYPATILPVGDGLAIAVKPT